MADQNSKNPLTGVNLGDARRLLAGTPIRRLDTDWLAVDSAGHVALFAGNERGPIPEPADVTRVMEALEAIARAAAARKASTTASEAYRGFADRAQDPVFDAPCSSRGRPTHEARLEGYPLLVVASHPGLREIAAEWEGREVVAREGYGIVFPVIGPMTYEEIHQNDLCLGCRVLDDPVDPRPRAPEALAAAGLFTYAHVGEMSSEPYRRVAGPSLAADLADLEPLVQIVASLVELPVSFEEAATLQPYDFFRCV
ncbi:MAG: hypothetical protein JWO86_8950 [Myxococcaceae bacterium]|nr:hypothetical protein [Myxococcaceae bacterium]